MSMMASATPENTTAPTIGLVAVALPADTQPIRTVWIDQHTLMLGYDPDRLTFDLVARLVREQYGVDVAITAGVPA